ncbi:LysM peptidoglycan-binding domain-containing protein [Agromyces sp. Marseille-P2726]|uniref:CIS tube protein n=1 Tax=Agromyces sp. Marseille-P2726 TaxID=2709132 RepID=UPI00156F9FDC|nr:LysM peptidoglycan-binding domain-containing protein [Agromyces sp. Marseille-P2726]
MPVTSTASDTAGLVHAAIEVHEPGQTPGKVGALLDTIEFQLNPKEVTIAKSAKWESKNQKKSASAPPATYQGPEPQKLSVEMYFDETRQRDGSVVKRVEALFQACTPTTSSKDGNKPSAPWVKFKWGVLTGFVGYIKSVSAKYTLFSPNGTPLRAVCTVALEELANEPKKQNPTSGGLQPRHAHTIREGDSLAAIAYREYGDPAYWRTLAEVNGIDDPLRLRPGRIVLIPTLEELSNADDRENARKEIARALLH